MLGFKAMVKFTMFMFGSALALASYANNVNPYAGTYDAENSAKRELAVLKVQAQIKQQQIEIKKEDFRLQNVDKVMKAELHKALKDATPQDQALASLERLPRAGGKAPARPAPAPEPVFMLPPPPPPPMATLDAVVRKGGDLAAIVTKGGQTLTVKQGDMAFGEKVGQVAPSSVVIGGRTLTMQTMQVANRDIQAGESAQSVTSHLASNRGQPQRPSVTSLPIDLPR